MPCIHRSRAVVDTRVKCTRRSPGPSFTSAAIFRSFDRSGFTGLTLQLPSSVRVRLRLPLRPCIHD
ncbi:DUF1472 domain-containing protein (plasmid) [Salmonella enterica]|nr:DUF1472 domain-containing protein [Salmonella enterica]